MPRARRCSRSSALESIARTTSSVLRELREGWAAFVEQQWIWSTCLWISLYFVLTYAPFFVLGPYIAKHSMHGASSWYPCHRGGPRLLALVAPEKLARVGAYAWMSAMIFLPAGYALAGPISAVVGMRGYLLFGAAWLLASTAVLARLPSIRDVTDEVPAALAVPS